MVAAPAVADTHRRGLDVAEPTVCAVEPGCHRRVSKRWAGDLMCQHHYNIVRCGWVSCAGECGRWAQMRGYCTTCFAYRKRYGQEPRKARNVCSVGGCGERLAGSMWPGMCAFHGYRMKRYGIPQPTGLDIRIARLGDRIDKLVEAPCWRWIGPSRRANPGASLYGCYGTRAAHRVVYEALIGPIGEGLWIDHLCRNTLCVNPEHLEPVTPRENLRRAYQAAEPSPKAASYVNRRGGKPIRPDFRDFADRFWEHANPCEGDACWEWSGWKAGLGYGVMPLGERYRDRTRIPAHRYSHELLIGPIPPGAVVDHLCCNKGCVNPAHLEAVAQRENTRRALILDG